MSVTSPVASGYLAKTSLASVLLQLLDFELSGTLVFEAPDGVKSALSLVKGVPAKAKTGAPVIYLGRLLLEQGVIDEATESRSLVQLAAQKRLHGQILVELGAVSREQLVLALQEQLYRKIEWLFELPLETAYGFYQDKDFLQQFGGEPTPIRPLLALWRGVRRWNAGEHIARGLEQLGERVIRFHPDAAIKKFNFSKAEHAVIDVLRAKPQPFSALVSTQLLPEEQLKRLIYTLFVSRHIDLGVEGGDPIGGELGPSSSRKETYASMRGGPEPSSPATSRPPPRKPFGGSSSIAPGASAAADDSLREEITKRYESLDKQSYYELLGVTDTSSGGTIQAAFFQLAKKFHPDKIGGRFPDLRDQVNKIFSRISEAHQILADEEKRFEYDRLLREGGDSAEDREKVQAVLRAAQNFQKAEVLLKKQSFQAAADLAKAAADEDPEQADYIALYAWASSYSQDRVQNGKFDDLLKLLDGAVEQEPNNTRVRWYRGQVLKRAGEDRKALKDFRWVLEHEPKHLDAQREIRLYEMRRITGGRTTGNQQRSSSSPPANSAEAGKGGLNADVGQIWGKLFKRDRGKPSK